jgi:hypothetical protein
MVEVALWALAVESITADFTAGRAARDAVAVEVILGLDAVVADDVAPEVRLHFSVKSPDVLLALSKAI